MQMLGQIVQVVTPALQASRFARRHVVPRQQLQEHVLPRQQWLQVVKGMKKATFPLPKYLDPIIIVQTLS